ncbi:hypothetical protein [Streptomyces chrestomyceticus]|uniref:Uncharacterized protein n=1 Tax=Streptomyces chrestomyceticus TaxID=68185 RepID=A0ABU7WLR8_9ACTN
MVFTCVNVTTFAVQHHVRGWVAWMLDPLASLALLTVLYVDGVLAEQGGYRASGWPFVLRWFAGLSTWIMNCWQSLYPDGVFRLVPEQADAGGLLLHSVAPFLLIILAEASAGYRTYLAARTAAHRATIRAWEDALAADRAARERQAQEERERAEAAEREQAREAARVARQQDEREAERAAREHSARLAREAQQAEIEKARELARIAQEKEERAARREAERLRVEAEIDAAERDRAVLPAPLEVAQLRRCLHRRHVRLLPRRDRHRRPHEPAHQRGRRRDPRPLGDAVHTAPTTRRWLSAAAPKAAPVVATSTVLVLARIWNANGAEPSFGSAWLMGALAAAAAAAGAVSAPGHSSDPIITGTAFNACAALTLAGVAAYSDGWSLPLLLWAIATVIAYALAHRHWRVDRRETTTYERRLIEKREDHAHVERVEAMRGQAQITIVREQHAYAASLAAAITARASLPYFNAAALAQAGLPELPSSCTTED